MYYIYTYNLLLPFLLNWDDQQIAWPSPLFEKSTSSEHNILDWDETASVKLFLCRTNLKLAKGSLEELHGSCLAPRACTGHGRKDHVAQILHCSDLARLTYLDLPTDRGHFEQSSSRLHVAIPVHHVQHAQKRVWEILATCHATASISSLLSSSLERLARQCSHTNIHTHMPHMHEHIASALKFASMTTNRAMRIQHGVFWSAAMHSQPLCFEDVAVYRFFNIFTTQTVFACRGSVPTAYISMCLFMSLFNVSLHMSSCVLWAHWPGWSHVMSLRVFLCIFLFVPVCVSLPEILRMFLIVSLHASRDVSLYVSLYVSSFVLFLFVKLQSCYARENHQKPSAVLRKLTFPFAAWYYLSDKASEQNFMRHSVRQLTKWDRI